MFPSTRAWGIYICLFNKSDKKHVVEEFTRVETLFHASRHFGLLLRKHQRGKRYLSSRLRNYSNTDACFQLTRLVISGDICPNPGPDHATTRGSLCSVCRKIVARNHRAINCDLCDLWCHIRCGGVKPQEYIKLQSANHFSWTCPACSSTLQSLPFANTSNLAAEFALDTSGDDTDSSLIDGYRLMM